MCIVINYMMSHPPLSFFETHLIAALRTLLSENEGVVVENLRPEIAGNSTNIVFRIGDEIILEPYYGDADFGDIIAVQDVDVKEGCCGGCGCHE